MQISRLAGFRTLPWRLVPAVLVAAVAAAVFPATAWDATVFALRNLVLVSPTVGLGVVLAAAVTASGSTALIAGAFRGRPLRMIALAALVGALTPVCGVSVLPLVAGLRAARVPLAPIMAFWLSSPITGPAMLAVTVGTLGLPFALGKTFAAFGIGVFGGMVTSAIASPCRLHPPERGSRHIARARAEACAPCGPDAVRWRFWAEPARRRVFCNVAVDTTRLVLTWLAIAFVAEYFLRAWLPPDALVPLVGEGSCWAVPLAALVGMPIYLDGYAALPLIRGLIDNGMRPDAAMAFLVAGGVTSAWAAIPVLALVRLPVFVVYVLLAIAGSMLAGWAYGLYL